MTGVIAHFDKASEYTLQFTVKHTLLFILRIYSRCLAAASNGGRSLSSDFPNSPRRQLPAYNRNSPIAH
jgi:hypothetical protein